MSCCLKVMKLFKYKDSLVIQPSAPEGRYQATGSVASSTQNQHVIKVVVKETNLAKRLEPLKTEIQSKKDEENNSEETGVVLKRRSGIERHNPEKNLENVEIVKHSKDKRIEEFLKKAIKSNEFLKNILDEDRLQQVVEAMRLESCHPKQFIITEGDYGAHLYVSEEGLFEVTKNGMVVKKFKDGETFGELAILYNTKRFASVQALTEGKLWVLDRVVYQKIMLKTAIEEHEANIYFLKNVPQFNEVGTDVLNKVANLLKREFFETGHHIVKQGERGDTFYIIKVGSVLITKRTQESPVEENVGTLRKGEYFGELALLQEDCRQANVIAQAPGVECLTLDRNNFIEHFGDLKTIAKDYSKPKEVRLSEVTKTDYSHIRFDDLDIIQTLGVGGFGRVELVQYRNDKKQTFALKYLKKVEMVQQQQQEHAYNEKMIMYSCNSNFICKLYKTYKDAKYIYFLMEVCLGGDVWTMLQKAKNRCFDEKVSRFMAACVVEAFDYLHCRDIIYRDLKPENLLIDSIGYIKLVDFGFAKKLGARGKTYTFAGTPEYVAPEIILNRGHDKAVDYWALGIFLHELMCGKPPFRGSDHMKTYNMIIRGIDHVDFPSKINRSLQVLIRKLCRSVPTDRLGCLKHGADDIRNNKWFLGFEWEALRTKQMTAPIKPIIKHSLDVSNFDKYPRDTDIPPDEFSGWDVDF